MYSYIVRQKPITFTYRRLELVIWSFERAKRCEKVIKILKIGRHAALPVAGEKNQVYRNRRRQVESRANATLIKRANKAAYAGITRVTVSNERGAAGGAQDLRDARQGLLEGVAVAVVVGGGAGGESDERKMFTSWTVLTSLS